MSSSKELVEGPALRKIGEKKETKRKRERDPVSRVKLLRKD